MASVIADAAKAADWIAAALSSSGYKADFTAASLWQVDFFCDDHAPGGVPKRGGLLADNLGSKLFALGAYVGEVIRRNSGGDWQGNDDDPYAEINIALHLKDGSIIWPMQRIMKRIKLGAEDGIAAYGVGMGLDVGPLPNRPAIKASRAWWRFW